MFIGSAPSGTASAGLPRLQILIPLLGIGLIAIHGLLRTALTAISGLLDRPTDETLAAGVTLVRRLAADGFLTRPTP